MFNLSTLFFLLLITFSTSVNAAPSSSSPSPPATPSAPTTPAPTTTTLRPTVIPNEKCAHEATMNIYLNYFFDTGLGHSVFDLYHNVIKYTAAQQSIGNPQRHASIYGANANGSNPPMISMNDFEALQFELFPLFNPPYYTSTTSSIISDLTYFQAVLPGQLTYSATPVMVIFLRNPLENVSASITKMNELKNANPTTYFIGILLSAEPTIAKLPFDFTLNLTIADNTAAQTAVKQIFNFICTVTPRAF